MTDMTEKTSSPWRNNGGRRAGAGRRGTSIEPATIRLSSQARQELRILLCNQRALRSNPELSQAQLLAEFVHEKWLEAEGATNGLDYGE